MNRKLRPLAAIALGLVPVLFALSLAAGLSPAETVAQEGLPLDDFDAACETENPFFVTTCYAEGAESDEPAIVAFKDTRDNSEHYVLATMEDVGATYGIAYQPYENAIYAAAYHKRGTPYGPGGPGMIYRIDLMTQAVEQWLDVPNVGRDSHDRRGDYWPDTRARNGVGVMSLGDIDLDEGAETLYVMNLLERKIYHYRMADKQLIRTIDHGAIAQPWEADARPFGLKVHQGKLYHGLVHSAARSRRETDLAAYVYESELDGSGMRQVNYFRLNFNRGSAVRFGNNGWPARWKAWRDGYNSIVDLGVPGFGFGVYPMPMLTDIEFADDNDMILGFRDRQGDMTFFDPGGRNPPGEDTGIPAGDIMYSEYNGDTWDTQTVPEHYAEDAGPGLGMRTAAHEETGFGGLARVRLADRVVTTGLAPEQISSGGGYWFDNQDGNNHAREELYNHESEVNFGKANGLGDVELLCREVAPTPTLTPSATATDTPAPTPTPEDTPTPVPPSATPTPSVYRIYLPFLSKDKICIQDAYRTDVVLVLDRSTSMLRSVEPGGIPKNEAAIAAAKSFVELLDLEPDRLGRHDQVAVVGFNDEAWIESMLTRDKAAALGSLDRIREKTQEGTRLDLAFTWGQKPLDGPERKPENRPVIIMLTDGLPNRVPFGPGSPYPGSQRQEDSVLQAVDAVKLAGTRVYTVGLGTPRDILPWLLIASASEPWMYNYAPRPEDLESIYNRIAATFDTCDPKPEPTPCVPSEQHADVVLVLDMSTSMQRTTRTGRAKYEAAIEAARTFVEQLDLEPDGWGRTDQVAIVGFNDRAWRALGLSDERAPVLAAIDGLEREIAEGTRIDLALAEGQRAFDEGERLQPNQPVMILLTDGLPNRVPFGPGSAYPNCPTQECTVLDVANQVKVKGTLVFTIGLGETSDVLRTLLEQVASDPGRYYFAPDGEDLAGIYREIAGRLDVCP